MVAVFAVAPNASAACTPAVTCVVNNNTYPLTGCNTFPIADGSNCYSGVALGVVGLVEQTAQGEVHFVECNVVGGAVCPP